ncbi:MAG: hypothetical protein IKN54_07545 [Lachnospiraceae bacterium]|nr:hypothetical protein [Lachnospiraceae bacterium]
MDKRFSEQAQAVLDIANEASRKMKMGYVGSEHILLGLCQVVEGVASNILYSYGVTYKIIFEEMSSEILMNAQSVMATQSPNKKPEFTTRTLEILDNAVMIAHRHELEKAGTEHILLAIIADEESQAHALMDLLGVEFKKMCKDILKLSGRDIGEYKEFVKI